MVDPELLEQLKAASVSDRIAVIEMILRSLKRDVRSASRQSIAENRLLRGKVRHYEDPYEPVAVEDYTQERREWLDRTPLTDILTSMKQRQVDDLGRYEEVID